ncbi:zinc ribbon-containing protein [Hymenobacter cellulosilyticus]|uniref:Zinc ribbon-containing protein n=1 Tax=Hymenobacter cellulosilyticus TaxID=2932248 RepID=A0A8T9Q5L6_9BACT|nr:zinc ribbon-containing protein [Hymenobacter cellulosilyticus]UOQ72864.1 zinc ribbon-containing protein [Hymenobacter cellulosilyticus]
MRQGVAALIRQLNTGRSELPDSLAAQQLPALGLAGTDSEQLSEIMVQRSFNAWGDGETVGVMVAVGFLVLLVLYLWLGTKGLKSSHLILSLGLVLILGLLFLTVHLDWALPPALFMALSYAWPLLYVHGYLLLVNQELARGYARKSRHARYTFLNETHYGLGWLRFLFPLGLAWYWPRYQRRLAALREEPYDCPACAAPMYRLDELQDDHALQPGQVTEELIEAVDYDVWHCPGCHHQITLDYANLSTDAEPCPECHHRTFQPQPDEEMQAATTSHGGWGWHVHECAFCRHVKKVRYTTSKLSSSSSSSSGGSSFSSGGSSSSSSSGGSSGGGGAGSSW